MIYSILNNDNMNYIHFYLVGQWKCPCHVNNHMCTISHEKVRLSQNTSSLVCCCNYHNYKQWLFEHRNWSSVLIQTSKNPSALLSEIYIHRILGSAFVLRRLCAWWNPACLDLLSRHIHHVQTLYTPSTTVNMSGAMCDLDNLTWVTVTWTFLSVLFGTHISFLRNHQEYNKMAIVLCFWPWTYCLIFVV